MTDQADTETVSAYSRTITFQKYAIELGILLAVTGVTWVLDSLIPGLSIDYPQYAGILILVVPFIEAFRNWLKHRNDTVVVKKET